VRIFLVFVALVGAGACSYIGLRDQSGSAGIAAAALILLAVTIAWSGRRSRKRSQSVSASPASHLSAPPRDTPRAPEAVPAAIADTSQSVVVDAPSSDVQEATAEADDGIPMTDEHGPDVMAASPEPAPSAPAAAATASSVRTPFSVQPAVVLMSFYDAVAERFDTLAAHVWLEDRPTDTLRLVAAFGPRVPSSDPVPISDPILGAAARTRTAVFARVEAAAPAPGEDVRWRYAVPIGTPEVRGVAAVDVLCSEPAPSAVVLNEVSAMLRGSLTAALAVHVARAEMDAAVLLLQTAQDLASGMTGESVLASALDRAMQIAGASTGSIMMPDAKDGTLRIAVSRGLPSDIVATTVVSGGEGIAGTVYATSAPLLVEDLPGRSGQRRHGVLSAVSVPIADSLGSYGVMNVGSRAFPARLTDAYVRALGILGSQTAAAIRSADTAERSWDLYLMNLEALATALEADDPYRKGASKRVVALSTALGESLGLEGEDLISLRMAAILHDVGMGLATGSLGAFDRPLSTVDRGLVRAHPKVGSDVLMQVPSLESLAPTVRHHHERYDGDGYDMGLSGASIPLGSRILAVADSFVAMTSPRPYRDALDAAAAIEELNAGSGTQFDPVVLDAFIALLSERPELARVE
jgi:HD-GYP domain-containing protein (c-di-GMP phosphodiesterase class II)